MKVKYHLEILVLLVFLLTQNLFATEPIEMTITSSAFNKTQQNALFIAIKGLEQKKSFYLAKWKNQLFYKALLVDSSGKLYVDKYSTLKRYYVPIGQRIDYHEYIEYSVSFLPNSRFSNLVNNQHYFFLAIAKDAESNKLIFSNLVSFYLNNSFEVTDIKNVLWAKVSKKIKLIINNSILQEFETNKAEVEQQLHTILKLK
jgi:hypothetical protein